jgi:hypothetical protein
VLAAGAWFFVLRSGSVSPTLTAAFPVAKIGSGEDAVGVAADGTVLAWMPPGAEGVLPSLPLGAPPRSGRLAGPALAQVRVLGAAPAALRGCVERSYFGESGVDVVLDSGIELRFGDASRAARKWRAAATVLADPSITALDYVDLHSPGRPAAYGSGHALPPASEASRGGCGG